MADFECKQKILDKVFGEGMRKWHDGDRPKAVLNFVRLKAELENDEKIDEKTREKSKNCSTFFTKRKTIPPSLHMNAGKVKTNKKTAPLQVLFFMNFKLFRVS